jgi:hypothetical protein
MARTHLKPEHFGEALVAALLRQIAERDTFAELHCYSTQDRQPVRMTELLARMGIGRQAAFHDNVELDPVTVGETRAGFDKLSQIDCLVEDGQHGIAVEIKLGLTRMGVADFEDRFFDDCGWSRHVPPQIKGNMIAILDGRFSQRELAGVHLSARIGNRAVPLSREWLLLLRGTIWQKWAKRSPSFNRPCHVILFEEFVPAVGGPEEFDGIVRELIGNEFAAAWGLCQ